MEEFARCTNEFTLIPSPYKLANGDNGFKVEYRDFADYLTPGFFQAKQFWNDYRKYSERGMFAKDYRSLTCQQKAVLDIFDSCYAIKQNSDAEKNAISAKAQEEAKRLRGFKG